jgi:EmrB/QacA subfamily drug resistance transporter
VIKAENLTPFQRNAVLLASGLGAFAAAVMATGVNVALPSLVAAFEVPYASVQWVVIAYLLSTAALLPLTGRWADMVGKRVIFAGGFAVYTAASLASAFAPTIEFLIASRLLAGVGSAILTGLGLAIVTDVFPPGERGRALGINGAILSVGIVVGPTLGGLVVSAGWPFVFLLGVPIGLVGLALALAFVPRYPRGPKQPFDVPGSAVLTGAITSLSLAMTAGQSRGFTDTWVLAGFVIFALSLPLFVWIERHAEAPVVDLTLFKNPQLSVSLVAGLGAFISISGTIFVMPFYLENVVGLSPRSVGLLLSTTPILLVFLAPMAGRWADRYGERIVTVFGIGFAFVGFSLVGTLGPESTALGFLARFFPIGIGLGLFQTPNNSAIMGSVPPGRSGVAGGLLGISRTLGQAAGTAVLGSVWAARVLERAGAPADVEAALLPPAAQAAGLQDMMLVVQGIMLASLVLVLWDWRRLKRVAAADETPLT